MVDENSPEEETPNLKLVDGVQVYIILIANQHSPFEQGRAILSWRVCLIERANLRNYLFPFATPFIY